MATYLKSWSSDSDSAAKVLASAAGMLSRACEHAVSLVPRLQRCAKRKLEVFKEACVEKHNSIWWGNCFTHAAQAAAACLLSKHPFTKFNMMLGEGSKCGKHRLQQMDAVKQQCDALVDQSQYSSRHI